ncbi:MAG: DUF5916 domain-containing protein, partial [Gammaproteobacteria bacterium]|nr:DUF5916 domain-containing protein [Gammaproteobacteria bacterium]
REVTPIRYILVSLSSFLLALTLNAEEATSTVQNTSLEVDSVELQDIRFAGYLEDSSVAMAVTRFAKNPAIKIDGHIDEDVWLQVVPHDRFVVTNPDTLEIAPLQTKVRMAYNDSGFYLAAEMIQDPDTLIRRLSARDEGFLNRDYFSFQLDTSGEGRYGFWFQLNLGDSRADGTVKPERQFSDNWDGAWYGQTQSTDYGWTAEFFIPWSVVAMPKVEGMRKMGIYMSRKVASVDQRYSWPALPFTQPKFLSAFQPLLFESVNAPRQLSFIPYISSSFDSISDDSSHSLGTDFFWRPSTNFQVTATMLPDFGTVESDSVIVNLTAIETFYPEKRLFFLEGQEIFQMSSRSGGFSSNSMVSMLHTRRIGQKAITPDIPEDAEFTWSDFSRPVDLLRAGKTTGTAGEFSYGFLAAQEDDSTFHGTLYGEPISINQSGRDFGVVRGLWEKSNGSYKGLGFMSTKVMHPTGDVHTDGVDTHYFSADGKFKVDSTLMMSDLPNDPTGYGAIVDIQYAPKRGVRHELALEQYDDEF